jgi:hypothetical protein
MRSGVIRIGVALGVVVGLAVAVPAGAAPIVAGDTGAAATGRSAVAAQARMTGDASPAVGKSGRAAGVRAHLDGQCNPGDLCLWYFKDYQGSAVDFYDADGDMRDNVFLSPGAGRGAVVANNSESVWNYDPSLSALLCTGTYGLGDCTNVAPNSGFTFYSRFGNDIESLRWLF